jgi:hypothetical protein
MVGLCFFVSGLGWFLCHHLVVLEGCCVGLGFLLYTFYLLVSLRIYVYKSFAFVVVCLILLLWLLCLFFLVFDT